MDRGADFPWLVKLAIVQLTEPISEGSKHAMCALSPFSTKVQFTKKEVTSHTYNWDNVDNHKPGERNADRASF